MKTTTLLKTLPVLGLTLALSACGGDEDDGGPVDPGTASITACYTANKTVSFTLASSGVPSGSVAINRSTTGPTTYNGQAVTGQTFFYPGTQNTETNYWTVTSSGVKNIAGIDYNKTVIPDDSFFPQDMKPGQTTTNSSRNISTTLVGFESLNLSGKTFLNTCHTIQTLNGNRSELWVAPGYGAIKQIAFGVTLQYSGDL
jgi:hypothetical protein